MVSVVRESDLDFEDLTQEEMLECHLVGAKQYEGAELLVCPVEQLLLLKGGRGIPGVAQRLAVTATHHVERTRVFLLERVGRALAVQRQEALRATIPEREEFLQRGFDYQEAELAAARVKQTEKVRAGNRGAQVELARIRQQQKMLMQRRQQAIAVLHREPALLAPRDVMFIAHALVVRSHDPEEQAKHDAQTEEIAMALAWAYEESTGAIVQDVHMPELARAAGLSDHPGFDLLSTRPDGEKRAIDFNRIQNELDALEGGFTDEAKRILHASRDRYLEKLREAVKREDKEAIKSLELAFSREYSKLLKDFMKESFTYGKNAAAREMDVQAPANPQQMLAIMDTEADAIATKHAQQLTSTTKQGLLEAMKKQAELNAIIGALHEKMTSEIARLTGETGSIVAGGYLNQGRNTVFDAYEDRIYALQRSEILDLVTCNYCLSVDGRIIEKGDSYAKNTIFHSHCRGIWVEILQAEEEKPKIEGIPQSLRDRFGDVVNALIQPKNPVTKKNSLAQKFIQSKR
jgi:hypothetical protein